MSRLEALLKKYGWKGPRDAQHREQIIRDAAYGNVLYEKPYLTREEFDRRTANC